METIKKAALFDMDGLMYDTERISMDSWMHTAKTMHFDLTQEQCDLFRGTNKEMKRNMFYDWYKDSVDYETAFAMHKDYMNDYISQNGVPVKKGLYELLESLKMKDYKIAVATSTARKYAVNYWKQTHVYEYLDADVCGDEVTKSKPSPEIFLKAADKLCIPIEQCLVFEDSFNGVLAASASGAIVVMIPDLSKPTVEIQSKCNYIFEDLSQAIGIL